MTKTFFLIILQEIKGINRKKRLLIQFTGLILFVYFLISSPHKALDNGFSFSFYGMLFFAASIFLYLDIIWKFFHTEGGLSFYRIFPISTIKIKIAHFMSVFLINFLFLIIFSLAVSILNNVNLLKASLYMTAYILILVEIAYILGTFKTFHFSILGMPILLILSIFRQNTYTVLKLILPPFGTVCFGWMTTVDVFAFLLYQIIFVFIVFINKKQSLFNNIIEPVS